MPTDDDDEEDDTDNGMQKRKNNLDRIETEMWELKDEEVEIGLKHASHGRRVSDDEILMMMTCHVKYSF